MAKILLVAAAGQGVISRACDIVKNQYPIDETVLLLPADAAIPCGWMESVLRAGSNMISPSDLTDLPASNLVVLAIGHVGRKVYREFVAILAAQKRELRLFTPSAPYLQVVDERDATTDISIRNRYRPSSTANAKNWIFFRAWDKPAQMIARDLKNAGNEVRHITSVAEFEKHAPDFGAVFLDWCITDYSALGQVIDIAKAYNMRIEAWLALDLADLAENRVLVDKLRLFNQNALAALDKAFILASRYPVFEKKYNIDKRFHANTSITNIIDTTIWNRSNIVPTKLKDDVLRIAYHGLFYYWHEVVEFIPVYEALLKKHKKVSFSLFGRIHESIEVDGISLFPEKEAAVRDGLERLSRLPGVKMRGFTELNKVVNEIRSSDFYLGITAGVSTMATTETRTGVCEALALGARVLHKTTPAVIQTGLRPDVDYLAIDAHDPDIAANKIIEAWRQNR